MLAFAAVGVGSYQDPGYRPRIGHRNFDCNRLAVAVAVFGCIDCSLAGYTAGIRHSLVAAHIHIVGYSLRTVDIADQVETMLRLAEKSWLLV